jgi:hypothetical protein
MLSYRVSRRTFLKAALMVGSIDTPDWQGQVISSPSALSITITYQLAAGAHQLLIPAIADKTILILGMTWVRRDPSGLILTVEDTDELIAYQYVAAASNPFHEPWYGTSIAKGKGLQIKNYGVAGMQTFDVVSIFYQQG